MPLIFFFCSLIHFKLLGIAVVLIKVLCALVLGVGGSCGVYILFLHLDETISSLEVQERLSSEKGCLKSKDNREVLEKNALVV